MGNEAHICVNTIKAIDKIYCMGNVFMRESTGGKILQQQAHNSTLDMSLPAWHILSFSAALFLSPSPLLHETMATSSSLAAFSCSYTTSFCKITICRSRKSGSSSTVTMGLSQTHPSAPSWQNGTEQHTPRGHLQAIDLRVEVKQKRLCRLLKSNCEDEEHFNP